MKLLLFAACIAAALNGNAQNSVKPVPSSKPASFSLKYEKFVLPNGLKVVLHEDHSDPIVAVSTIVHVGSNREKPGKTGFAHFFEHMSFNHSENTPVGANRKLIPEWGGDRNGGTWSDGTATLASLQIISDMLKDYGNSFTDNEVAITKNKVLKGSTLTYERLAAKLGMLSDISKYNRPLNFIEEDQSKLVALKLDDYKQVINTHLKEEDMIYVVVGDKATQLAEVKKLGKVKVIQLDIYGNPIAD